MSRATTATIDVNHLDLFLSEDSPMTSKYTEIADNKVNVIGLAGVAGRFDLGGKVVRATHAAPPADQFGQKHEGTAWRSKPSWYIVANNDRTVPDLQRFVAKRMGATLYETDSSHVAMLSNPALVINVIRTAAKAVQGKLPGRPGR